MREGRSDCFFFGGAVNVDVTAHGIDLAEAVEAELAAGQPEDAGEYPIALGVLGAQLWSIDFTGGTAAHKYTIEWLACSDFGADDMFAARRAVTALKFARAVFSSGNGIALDELALLIKQFQRLRCDVNFDLRQFSFAPEVCGVRRKSG